MSYRPPRTVPVWLSITAFAMCAGAVVVQIAADGPAWLIVLAAALAVSNAGIAIINSTRPKP